MKAVWLQVPEEFLAERSRLGRDRHDEVWEGVLHMVPAPKPPHQRVEGDLLIVLRAIASKRGLVVLHDTDTHDPATTGYTDYREPDLVVAERAYIGDRGIEGVAELAVEIISAHDESREKLPFYARVGVKEVWLIDPRKLTLEVFTGMTPIAADNGVIRATSLGLELRVDGSTLKIAAGADLYEVDIRDVV